MNLVNMANLQFHLQCIDLTNIYDALVLSVCAENF
jgi:hypothetical protein